MTATAPETPTSFDPEALLAARLTLEEKASLVCGTDLWHLPAVPRLGIGAIRMTDGPAGARGTQFDGNHTSVLFPSPIMLASTANPALAEQVGAAMAIEAKAKGAHVLLGPTINLVRHPLAGRNFECFGEDPDLTAALAAGIVRGIQSQGVAACPKHLVAHDQETNRMTVSAQVDDQTLQQVYLKPFYAAMVEAGAWTCMAAYNRLNGTYCSEDPWLLTTVIRDTWGWDGAVISDWGAVHTTTESLWAGCDIEMPGPSKLRGQTLVDAIGAGHVDVAFLDRSVRRILLLAHRVGVLGPPGDPPVPAAEQDSGTEPQLRGLLRAVAVAGTVTLRDDGSVLPIPNGAKVAIVGPQGARLHVGGGGSAALRPPHVVHAPDGLIAAGMEVVVEPGCPPNRPLRFDPEFTSVTVEEMASDGTLQNARISRISRWLGLRDVPPWVRITLDHTAVANGRHTLRIHSFSDLTVSFDGEVKHQGPVDDRLDIPVYLFKTRAHRFIIEAQQPEAEFAFCDVRLMDPPDKSMFDRAIAAARAVDYAVVVVGLDEDDDCEGFDRRHFALPADQVTLARAVVAAQRRTAVVVNAGAPVDLSFVEDLPCVLWLSPPGQEGGYALADVLTNPAAATGRLPFTVAKRIEDSPAFQNFPGDGTTVNYAEGDLVGWRWFDASGLEPRYRFGHGRCPDRMTSFPEGFIWGTATAAHQIEGGNTNNDWWEWEHNPNSPCKESSGDACDSYHRFADDVRISADLGLTTYRFSLEWSRIEPSDKEFSQAALDHYKRCCALCWEAGVTPMVTFHHFTTPTWLARQGGWENPDTADRFARFSERSVTHLGDVIGKAFTLNEPNVVAVMGYLLGAFPPGRGGDMEATLKAGTILADAHHKGRDAIKAGPGDFEVGLTLAMFEWEAVDGATEADIDVMRADYEDSFLAAAQDDDFFGVQTYTRMRVAPGGQMRGPEEGHPLTKFNWEDRPQSLAWCVRRAWSALGERVPILVTENGISTDDDERRIAFTRDALAGIRECIDDGIDVRGYIHWTLLDNFEWTEGFEQTFGLVAVDRTTFERKPKPSAEWLGRCAKANAIVE